MTGKDKRKSPAENKVTRNRRQQRKDKEKGVSGHQRLASGEAEAEEGTCEVKWKKKPNRWAPIFSSVRGNGLLSSSFPRLPLPGPLTAWQSIRSGDRGEGRGGDGQADPGEASERGGETARFREGCLRERDGPPDRHPFWMWEVGPVQREQDALGRPPKGRPALVLRRHVLPREAGSS